MRIHVLSDLHQEFGEIDVPDVNCDCVVLAGDVSTKLQGLRWIERRFKDKPVIYICGNHEYYSARLPRLSEKLREETTGTNIHFLENDHVVIDGICFFGCTLWTDMALQGAWQQGAAAAAEVINDYKRVRNSARGYKKLSPVDTQLLHYGSLAAMEACLSSHEPGKTGRGDPSRSVDQVVA